MEEGVEGNMISVIETKTALNNSIKTIINSLISGTVGYLASKFKQGQTISEAEIKEIDTIINKLVNQTQQAKQEKDY
ncbi:1565_t:CDS:2 [Entrophospora sp. SA101]|nr:8588_t:CDS:2 [Entrophospora sp. SA101]CAJ0753815.1 17203_t:CDS:2 [Entrophospora sp. SA101]CAJ0763856.1 5613_t:CDS:2 [Entrophospora sp. SA101]CAJ0764823.1 1565_t:CDS:2 [Entrophospora sp. SA101]CAJ0905406.1 8499_t:CDS:2 [Entrophospora sp. SA101]